MAAAAAAAPAAAPSPATSASTPAPIGGTAAVAPAAAAPSAVAEPADLAEPLVEGSALERFALSADAIQARGAAPGAVPVPTSAPPTPAQHEQSPAAVATTVDTDLAVAPDALTPAPSTENPTAPAQADADVPAATLGEEIKAPVGLAALAAAAEEDAAPTP